MSKFKFFVIDSCGFWTIFSQISWKSNDWIVRNQQVWTTKAIGLHFLSNSACAVFNWVLSKLKNQTIAEFFALLPFLTYFCYKRLKPSTHCVQLWRKIAKIEWVLSTKNDRCQYQQHVCFSLQSLCTCWIASARARTKTVFGHLKCS